MKSYHASKPTSNISSRFMIQYHHLTALIILLTVNLYNWRKMKTIINYVYFKKLWWMSYFIVEIVIYNFIGSHNCIYNILWYIIKVKWIIQNHLITWNKIYNKSHKKNQFYKKTIFILKITINKFHIKKKIKREITKKKKYNKIFILFKYLI
jgi:hypothetical protein